MQLSIKEIKEILSVIPVTEATGIISNEDAKIETLLTDSRNLHKPEGTLFFAIRTKGGNDGHNFIEPLYKKGVKNFISEYVPQKMKDKKDVNIITVKDVVKALSLIGSSNRKNAKNIVAITGSSGKTTLKEFLFQLLEPLARISRSPRSYNSKIGVPLSLWQVKPKTEYALIEAGISMTGEMTNLREIIKPDTVIFTNIGEAHSSGFSSMEEKAKEKLTIAESEGVKNVIFNADDPILKGLVPLLKKPKNIIGWSFKDPESDLFLKKINDNRIEYVWKGEKRELEVNADKDYDFDNIASALAFLLNENINPALINQRFKEIHSIETRLNVSEGVNGCTIVTDSYPSDINTLSQALDFTRRRKTPDQKLTLIMSDVINESEDPEKSYKKIVEILSQHEINRFIGVGSEMCRNSNLFPSGSLFFPNTDTLLSSIFQDDFSNEIILLKGGQQYEFEKISELLDSKRHETLLEINLDALVANYNYFRSKLPRETGLIAMVKASGYGAGSFEIAKTLQDAGASYLAVAVLDEGIDLRKRGIVMPIMVMNPRSANYGAMFSNRLEPEIYSFPLLRNVIDEAEKYGIKDYPIHIKLDTGMHRMGFIREEIESLIFVLKSTDRVKVSSIFSHLATADCIDMDDFTNHQLQLFDDLSETIIGSLGYPVKRHILNSAGILRFPEYHYDFARLGIGLYGANTLPPDIEEPLATVSTLKTVIISIREWDSSETIGYGRKGRLKGKTKVATIPIGYADGMNRHFGNGNISVIVNGKEAPTIGNICMDATMIDVTGIDCNEGDYVEIFGENVSIQRLADILQTIPYEILTSISPRVKRIYYRE